MARNLTYIGCGNYLIPDIRLSYTEPLNRNKFVQMAEAHLRENNPFLYNDMILDEKLFPYLKEIGKTANRRMEQLMEELLEKNPAPDKAIHRLVWVQHMNMLKAQTEEIVAAELIYS